MTGTAPVTYEHKATGRQATAPKGSRRDVLMAADPDNWEPVKAPAKAAAHKAEPTKGSKGSTKS